MTQTPTDGGASPADKPKQAIPEELQEFGHYALEKELGRGAQGVVYLAEDLRLRRKVALKVLTGAGARSPEVRERFRREAEIASKLEHPGLCGVHEVGEVRGLPYIAMQYLRGTTLAGLIELAREGTKDGGHEKRVDPTASMTSLTGKDAMQDVLRVIEQTARSLHAAHEVGLLHRDVKPGNIMITPDGQPVLLDFGLARDIEDQGHTITETGAVMGTPAYMAAEQLRGQRDQVDRRTDVYSLGVVLYESLTLKLPFDATSFEVLYNQILQGVPANPQRLNPRIPTDLRTVIEVAMERDRERRYATALELAEDLRRVRTFEPIRAKPAGPLVRARKWAHREPAKAVALGALLFFGLAGAIFLVNQRLSRLGAARGHLARAEQLLTSADFNGALEAVAQSRERDPDSAHALEVKARIEAAQASAAQEQRRRSDLLESSAAREESVQKQSEHARLRTRIVALQQALREERAKVLREFTAPQVRTDVAAQELELSGLELEAERLLQDSQEALERAARLEASWGGSPQTEEAFAGYYLERWREALAEADAPRASAYASLVERHDPAHAHARELLGRGLLTFGLLTLAVDPPEAQVFLFRYESLETLRPGPLIPRLVPVPTRGTGHAREGPWMADFHPGDKCLRITGVEGGSPAESAGLRTGDLVIRLDGQPVGDGLFVRSSEEARIQPLARIATLNGTPIESRFDWSNTESRANGALDEIGLAGGAEKIACDRGALVLARPEELVEKGCPAAPIKLLCLHEGAPLELVVSPTGGSGLHCERTAYPLIACAENRIAPGSPIEVDPGSYLVLVRAPGYEEQQFPVLVPRLAEVEPRVELLRAGTTPAGFVYVPPGPFVNGGDPEAIEPALAKSVELPGFFIARREVTNAEWAEFVGDPLTQERIRAAGKPLYFQREQNGAPIPEQNRGGPSTPVMGIPWNDVRDFLEWRNRKAQLAGDPMRYDLPTEREWEKAARGVDARAFPWGNRFDFALVVGLYTKAAPLFSAPGGFEPCDESPFGVQDAGGLRQEWTSTIYPPPDPAAPPMYRVRGGCWIHTRDSFFRTASRFGQDASTGGGRMGFRLVARRTDAGGAATPTER